MAHLAAVLGQEAGACVSECFVAVAGAGGTLPANVLCAAADGPADLYAMLTNALTPVRLILSFLSNSWCCLPQADASHYSSFNPDMANPVWHAMGAHEAPRAVVVSMLEHEQSL